MANAVQNVRFLGYSEWSPSCRYFTFALHTSAGTDTVMWDTVEQKQHGTFHRNGQFDPPFLDWSDTDDYLAASNYVGEFLWEVASNKQIQLNSLPDWYFGWPYFTWDNPHGQLLMFDGRYVVAFNLNTGKVIRKYISPFQNNMTQYKLSPDGRSITIWDQYLDKWSVTVDRATGDVIDAKAEPGLPADQVQFSPDRHYLAVGGYSIDVYDVNGATTQTSEEWSPVFSLVPGYYTWRFVDSTTFAIDYTRTGKHQLYDLKARKFR